MTEELKSLEVLTKMDEKHRLMGAVCGAVPDLEKMHQLLSQERLNDQVPEEIKGQFNVARNMALYTYFFYALAPEVHLKTYTLIEHALKLKLKPTKYLMLAKLLRIALDKEWISDAGFRHIENPSKNNPWCQAMLKGIPDLRNSQAHGSSMLIGDCIQHIAICADFINQLFPGKSST